MYILNRDFERLWTVKTTSVCRIRAYFWPDRSEGAKTDDNS